MFLDELAAGLARRGAPIAAESATFIVLEAMEALGSRALVLSPSAVRLAADGTVALGGAVDVAHDETSVLEGAVETLEAVLDPAPVAVTELAVKVRTAQIITRGALLAELGAMLVPLNRRAARRLVGRLVRECARAAAAPAVSSSPPDADDAPPELLERATPEAPAAPEASDTVIDGASPLGDSLRTSLGGRLPEGWDDDGRLSKRRRSERRNAWVAMAVAVVALAAAVVFLVGRVRAAGA